MQRDPHNESTETLADGPRTRKREREAPTRLGRYMILSELGRGGMSVVYVAYDPQLDRRVALKVVRGDQLSKAHRARLHREAQALARLSHPSVVPVFDVGDIGDDTFVAMELIDGMSLRDWLMTPRTWREIVRVIVAAGRGLAAAHAAGIVHRDVKPDNIVIATTGAVKLVDFGLARDLGDRTAESGEHPAVDDLELAAGSIDTGRDASSSGSLRPLESITRVGNVVGTPAYMPPEARRRNNPETDQRSDQFSLCVTIYEALFGQKPFEITSKGLLARAEAPTVADDPNTDTRTLAAPPPRDTNVPAWLQKVVSRGLAVEPRHRYPSVDALLAALDRDPERTRRRIGAAAGVLLAVAGIAIFATSRMMPAQDNAAPTCDSGDSRVAAVWNPVRLAAMKQATKGLPWASASVDAFGAQVERYAGEWKATYQDACQATRVRLVQSAEALDLRMACLDRRLESLGALVTLMASPTPNVLRRAGEVVSNLPAVADCSDVKALRLVVRRPVDPAKAARLRAIDSDIARLQASYAIGDIPKAVEIADHVITDATAVGYAPSLAQALYWKGRSLADRGAGGDAEDMFDKTFSTALGAGEDRMAADAAARLAQEALWTARVPEFERWQRVSHSLAERVGATNIVAFIDQLGCMANHWYGRPKTRLACLQALARRVGKPNEWLVTTLGIAATEAGAPGEAIHWLEQGVVLARAENGDDHPRTIEMRAYLCNGLNEIGEYKRSIDECRDALARLDKIAPDDKQLEARLQLYLGDALGELKHLDESKTMLEAAFATGDDEVKLQARTELSELAGKTGDGAASVAEQRAALAEAIKVYTPFNKRHPNITAMQHDLGVALLKQGNAAAALAELTMADTNADVDEISPLELAQLRFARSQALAKARPADRGEARALAAGALELYARNAPDTVKFRAERASIEAFIAKLDAFGK